MSSAQLVHLIAGFAAEQPREFAMPARQQVHGKVFRLLRYPVGVIALGQPDHEAPRPDADLTGEPDQTTRSSSPARVVTTYIG